MSSVRWKPRWEPQHWWPAGSAFEVVVGAYLTQNTAWTNVERAMGNLRRAGVLSISGIRHTPLEELEQLVRPSGYFRQKAARLKRFVAHLDAHYGGSLETMFAPSGGGAARGVAGAAGDWPGDGGFDPAVCGKPRGVCGGQLYAAHL